MSVLTERLPRTCKAGVKKLLPDFSQILEQKFNQKMIGGYTLGALEMCSVKKPI
jgi:hypothetical protein